MPHSFLRISALLIALTLGGTACRYSVSVQADPADVQDADEAEEESSQDPPATLPFEDGSPATTQPPSTIIAPATTDGPSTTVTILRPATTDVPVTTVESTTSVKPTT
ncbi:MAG: hypothetical protein ACN4GZ_13225, partial [Acidimicrobiales bacterium]